MDREERFSFNETTLTGLELRAHREGLDTVLRSRTHTILGRLLIIGTLTRYTHQLSIKVANALPSLKKYIEDREARLILLGYEHTGEWVCVTEKDDDGDRYIYDHYAVNTRTGQRLLLDISSNRNTVEHEEFRLHVMLKFPTRYNLGKSDVGPISRADLEQRVFGENSLQEDPVPCKQSA